MLNRAPTSLQRLLDRAPSLAVFGIRLYVAIAILQFVAGFVVGVSGSAVLLDYDLGFFDALFPAGG